MEAIASRFSSRGREKSGRKGRGGGSGERAERREWLKGGDGRSPLTGVLERLTRVRPGKHRVVSCYLKLEPRDRPRGKYLIKVKNRVKHALRRLPRLALERVAAEAVVRDL